MSLYLGANMTTYSMIAANTHSTVNTVYYFIYASLAVICFSLSFYGPKKARNSLDRDGLS
jgi:hypothetical protein